MNIDTLIHRARRNNPLINGAIIKKAYLFARDAHRGQRRESGELYITHPVAVAAYLVPHHPDEKILIAALLHDVLEDTTRTRESLESTFGEPVVRIIDLLTKKEFWQTSFCKMKNNLDEMENGGYPEAILIKIADRIHNLETLHALPTNKQHKKINETRDMLIPQFENILHTQKLGELTIPLRKLLQMLIVQLQNIDNTLPPNKQQQRVQKTEKLGIIKYQGIEGIKQVFEEVLAEAISTEEDILAYESSQDANVVGDSFFAPYIKRREENGVRAKVICPDTPEDHLYRQENAGPYTQIKIHSDFNIKANINIVGDLVMTFTIDPPQGTLRLSPAEATTQKEIFQTLWKSLKD